MSEIHAGQALRQASVKHPALFGSQAGHVPAQAAASCVHLSERIVGKSNFSTIESLEPLNVGGVHVESKAVDDPDAGA